MDKCLAVFLIVLGLCLLGIAYINGGFAGRLEICNEMRWKSEACVAEWSRRVSDAGIENFEGEVK